jgi:hypothetical protein
MVQLSAQLVYWTAFKRGIKTLTWSTDQHSEGPEPSEVAGTM